ncbi:FimV/HubP family polar landmark protein [Vibrio gallicus]|uniref:FimV/HubP family polar landmark protein n=1 Tax=Vibrio gallicus TaxID=190897 RepID=UPI0021C3E029|nr:FimV/HubP family polar landmark protein [Vibrio gallicus]
MRLRTYVIALLALLTLSSSVLAEQIRLIGPDGEMQAVPTYIVPDSLDGKTINRVENKLDILRSYGPTAIDETLWSIAKSVRSSSKQSVYKMILAIYRANPTAFEDQNIHLLKPGSTILIPTDAEVNKQSVQEAVRLLKIHAQKPSYLAKLAGENAPKSVVIDDSEVKAIQSEQLSFLKQQLQSSQQHSQQLQQNNQALLEQLTSIKTDVVDLKGKLQLESERRTNFEQKLSQTNTATEQKKSLLDDVWVIVALSVATTALIVLLIIRIVLSSVKALPNLSVEAAGPKELNRAPQNPDSNSEHIESAEATPKADDEPVQHVVSPLDQEFEQKLDEIHAKDKQSHDTQTTPSDNDEVWRDEDLPEYGEKEAMAEAIAEDSATQPSMAVESEPKILPEDKPVDESQSNYKSIATILAEVDSEPASNPDEEELDLRVGLDEFPDVIGKVERTDVDKTGELAGLIDLASVYVQMNDLVHAKKLLKTVIAKGDADLKSQAQAIMDSLTK